MNCSFCGRGKPEIFELHVGLDAQICDECIEVCASIVSDRQKASAAATPTTRAQGGDESTRDHCSFCRCEARDAVALIGGPTTFICDACVDMGMAILDRRPKADQKGGPGKSAGEEDSPPVICDFCGRTQSEASFMVKGESAAICDECIELTGEMFDGLPEKAPKNRRDKARCSFCGKPARKVRGLVKGVDCYICDGCYKACAEIAALKKGPDGA